jgi:heterodisulfide reductase subunit B
MHTDHTQLAYYMEEVAKASDRIEIETTGYTFADHYNCLLFRAQKICANKRN